MDDSAQLAAGLLAAACCAWMAARTSGVERAWRRLMAVGMAGWSVGQFVWSWYQIFAKTPLPSPSLADVGYLTLPVFALFALMMVAADGTVQNRRRVPAGLSVGRTRLVLVLDGLVVVGSLLILTWYTTLGAVVAAGAPTVLAFVVAIAYPTTDVMLVVIVVLLLATRPVASGLRSQLGLLGSGLVCLSLSDSIFAYLVSSGAAQMPPLANAGFVAGPVLIAVAAVTVGAAHGDREDTAAGRFNGWTLVLLPYLPLAATGVFVVGRQATGHAATSFELYLGSLVVALVVVRQMITLIDNTALLGHVTNAQQRLQYQASHDPLTGLANRELFHRYLTTAVGPDRGAERLTALLFIDLDDFKAVNDSLGHSVGDRVLQTVGARLRSCVRETDTVARLGGDEFAILVEADADSPDGLAQRILAALRAPVEINGHTVTIGASIGVAVPDGSESSRTAEGLLRQADAAMYAGKRRGKGLLVTYGSGVGTGGAANGHDHPDLPTLLAKALAGAPTESGLDVHYQPIVRISDGVHVAVEALARWTHPTIGTISPAEFVVIAEQTGLVGSLDDFVLDQACRELAARPPDEGMTVHVNVSASRFGNPDLETTVDHVLRRYGLDPSRLVLEITESSRIADPDAAVASAGRLRRMGVRLALDDFGTGYNSLAQLRLFPVDILKLDRNLTELDGPDAGGARSAAVCRSVVGLAADLGITVIAEAIESTGQEAMLAGIGCDYGQGYLYGRPAPLRDTFAPAHPGTLPGQRRSPAPHR